MEREQIQAKKIQLGEELSTLRKEAGITNYRSLKTSQIANQVVEAVLKGETNYTIETLLKLLQEVGKTIKIVDL